MILFDWTDEPLAGHENPKVCITLMQAKWTEQQKKNNDKDLDNHSYGKLHE